MNLREDITKYKFNHCDPDFYSSGGLWEVDYFHYFHKPSSNINVRSMDISIVMPFSLRSVEFCGLALLRQEHL